MRVDAGSNHLFENQKREDDRQEGVEDFSELLAVRSGRIEQRAVEESAAGSPDFSNMQRSELFSWMNNQIRSGAMTIEESSPFLGMVANVSTTLGALVDPGTDDSHIDFREQARERLDDALARFDHDAAERLKRALDMMEAL